MSKRSHYLEVLKELERIIFKNNKEGEDSGPIITHTYKRLCRVFNHTPVEILEIKKVVPSERWMIFRRSCEAQGFNPVEVAVFFSSENDILLTPLIN